MNSAAHTLPELLAPAGTLEAGLVALDAGADAVYAGLRKFNASGKIIVESKAEMKKRGVDSPNLADALVIAMSMQPEIAEEKKLKTTPGRARGSWMAH